MKEAYVGMYALGDTMANGQFFSHWTDAHDQPEKLIIAIQSVKSEHENISTGTITHMQI